MSLRDQRGLAADAARWQKAIEAHEQAIQRRNQDIAKALHGPHTARAIAAAYGLTPERVYQIAGKRAKQ